VTPLPLAVIEILYGHMDFRRPNENAAPIFDSHEVLDAILVARAFRLYWLLILLYKEGHFGVWGCAMWDSARLIRLCDGEDHRTRKIVHTPWARDVAESLIAQPHVL